MALFLRPVNTTRGLVLAATIAIGLAGTISFAADAPAEGVAAATSPPLEELIELDEVWVRGESLTRLIADAENALFARYNQLNRNSRFDVHCGDVALQRDSMIMTRTCLPGFLADVQYTSTIGARAAYYQPRQAVVSPTCYGPMTVDAGGNAHYEGGCFGVPADMTRTGSAAYSEHYSSYDSFAGQLLRLMDVQAREVQALHYRQEYVDNVMGVIRSDPQLTEMAEELVQLHAELDLTRQRYREVRNERSGGNPRRSGPRTQ